MTKTEEIAARGRKVRKGLASAIDRETALLDLAEHGVLRLAGSRIPIDILILAFEEGATPEEIAQQYPSLALADIYQFLGYYLKHRDEVDSYLAARCVHAEQVRAENEFRSNPAGIRKRLLSRRQRAK